MAEVAGRVEYGKDYKAKRRLRIVPLEGDGEPVEYLIPKGRHVIAQEGDVVEAGDLLVDGNPVPHDILRIKGVEALASFLVNEIQEVYRLQGVKINDKHVEVIVRQMLQKVEIADPGDTTFLVGEQVDKLEFDAVNERAVKEDRAPAVALPVFQGITKASLQTQSFISAASFQETTRVLTDAAFAGKVDRLSGLKENVIVGRLIPAGSGGVMNRLKRLAATSERFAPPREVRARGDGHDPARDERAAAGRVARADRRRRRLPRRRDAARRRGHRGLTLPGQVTKSSGTVRLGCWW